MKRGAVIGIIAGAVVLAVGGGFAWWALTRSESAEAAAHRYLDALESGDFATIDAMLPDTLSDADRAVLEQTFGGASAYFEDATIQEQSDDGGFRASVRAADAQGTIFFALQRSDDRWLLSADFLATLETTSTIGGFVGIGDATVPVGTTTVLPAVYAVRAAPDAVLAGETVVVATNLEPLEVSVEATLSPEANAAVQEQLGAYAQTCTAPAATIPAGCGIRVPWGADLASVTSFAYRIDAMPAVVLAADARSFVAGGGDLVVTATGTTRDGAAAAFTYRDTDWTLRGSIGFDEAGAILSVF